MHQEFQSSGGGDRLYQRMQSFFDRLYQQADQLHERLIGAYFLVGFLFGLYTQTWVVALLGGGFLAVLMIALMRNRTTQDTGRYLGSAVLGLFSWLFALQMDAGFHVEIFAYVAGVVLVSYRNWTLQVPLAIVILLLHLYQAVGAPGEGLLALPAQESLSAWSASLHASLSLLFFGVAAFLSYRLEREYASNARHLIKMKAERSKLQSNVEYAHRMAQGDLQTDIRIRNDDPLGKALADMRKALLDAQRREKRERFINKGIAEVGEILREHDEDLETLSEKLVRHLVRYLQINQGGLFILEEKSEEARKEAEYSYHLELKAAYAFDKKKHQQKTIEVGEGLTGQVVLEKESIYMTDVPQDYIAITSGLGETKPSCLLITPLKVNEQVQGVIELASFHPLPDYKLAFVERMAQSIASAIASAKVSQRTRELFEASQRQAKELSKKESTMRKYIQELNRAQDEMKVKDLELTGQIKAVDATLAKAEFDGKGKVIAANENFMDIMGYGSQEITQQNHRIFCDSKYTRSTEYQQFWEDLMNGLPKVGEVKRITKMGDERWLQASYTPVKDRDGNFYKVIKFAFDITEQKKSYMDFEGQLKAINRSNALLEMNMEGKILHANELFLDMLEYDLEEIRGKGHRILVSPEHRKSEAYRNQWQELKEGAFHSGTFEMLTRTGQRRILRGSYNPIFNVEGKPYKVVCFVSDITEATQREEEAQRQAEELKKKEEEMRINLEELRATQEEMNIKDLELTGRMEAIDATLATAQFDLTGNILEANEYFLQLFNYHRDELLSLNHSELCDAEQVRGSAYKQLWSELRKGHPQGGDVKRFTREGHELWLNASYTPVRDKNGKPYKIIMLATDITEQKQAALDFEGQLKAINTSMATIEFDMQGKILQANDILLETLGYTQQELEGQPHSVILPADHRDSEAFESMWENLRMGLPHTGVYSRITINGKRRVFRGSYNPILDTEGQPYKVVNFTTDITEAQEKEEELILNQIELKGQQSALNEAAIVTEVDLRGHIIYANDKFCDISGYSREEVIGQKQNIVRHPDMPAELFDDMWATIARGETWNGRIKNRTKDDDFYWVTATITPVLGDHGKPVKYIGVRFDITEQVRQEEEIKRQLQEIQANEEEMRQQMEEMTAIQEEMERSEIELRGQQGALNAAAIVSETDLRGYITYANDTFCEIAEYEREELIGQNHNIIRHPDMPSEAFEDMWKTIARGETWQGRVKNRTKSGGYYWVVATIYPVLGDQGKPVKYIGVRFDITEQVRQEEEIQRQLDEIRTNEEEMRQQMEEMTAIQEEMERHEIELMGQKGALDDAAIVSEVDLQGYITYANDKFCEISGYTQDELVGQKQNIVRHPDMPAEVFDELWQTITRGETWYGKIKNRRKDGGFYWVASTIKPVLNDRGKPVKYIGVRFDITEQMRQEEEIARQLQEIQNNEEEMRQQMEEMTAIQEEMERSEIELRGQQGALNAAAIVSQTDLRGYITYVNDTFCEVAEYERDELLGQNHNIIRHPDMPAEAFEDMWKTIVRGEIWQGRVKNRKKGGGFYWVQATIYPVLGDHGKPVKYIGVRFDITEQMRQEEEISRQLQEIQANEEEMRQQMEEMTAIQEEMERSEVELRGQQGALNAAAIVSETDVRGYITYVNDTFCEVAEYERDELIGQNHNIVRHSDSPAEVFEDLWKTISQGQTWRGRIKNLKKSGGFYWVDATIYPVLNDVGKPVKYIGVRFDITEQVRQEEDISHQLQEIQSNEEEMRQQMEEMTAIQEEMEKNELELIGQKGALDQAAIVTEVDLKGYVIYANDTFCEISGYEREEIIGQKQSLVRHPDMPASLFEDMWKTITRGDTWKGRIKNLRKDGGSYWVQATIKPLLNEWGKPLKYIGVRFDITEQVQQEEDIRQQLLEIQSNEVEVREQMEEMTAVQEEMERYEMELRGQKGALDEAAIVTEVDLQGHVIYANDTFCRISGYDREEVVGRKQSLVRHPDMPASLFEDMWKTITRGDTWKGRVKNRTKTGGFYWVDATIKPVLDDMGKPVKYIGVRFDITQQVIYEEQMQARLKALEHGAANGHSDTAEPHTVVNGLGEIENNEGFASINEFMESNKLVTEVDAEGNIMMANPAYCQRNGFSLGELVGSSLRQEQHPDVPAALYDDMHHTVMRGETWYGRIKNQTRRKEPLWVQAEARPVMDHQGAVARYIIIRDEITGEINDHKEISRLSEAYS